MHVLFKVILSLKFILLMIILFGLYWTLVSHQGQKSSNRFNAVIVFGDSFSYTGYRDSKFDQHRSTSTHRYQGRYCDGLVWIERLNVLFKYSYAQPSATSDNNFLPSIRQSKEASVPSVRQQIDTHLTYAQENNLDIIEPLYIIWIGFNDYFRYRSVDPRQIVKSIMNAVNDLLHAGAKNVLIFNAPPLQAFPCYRYINRSIFYTKITSLFNTEFPRLLIQLQQTYPNASIHLFDFHALFTKIITNTASIKFTNTVDSCLDSAQPLSANKYCTNPKEYVFLDSVHFTSTVHQLIAEAIQPFLSANSQKNNPDSYFYSRSLNQ